MLVEMLVAVTVAPDTMAPEGSAIVPTMVPVVVCATPDGVASSRSGSRDKQIRFIFMASREMVAVTMKMDQACHSKADVLISVGASIYERLPNYQAHATNGKNILLKR
jgi:hypothetical protein